MNERHHIMQAGSARGRWTEQHGCALILCLAWYVKSHADYCKHIEHSDSDTGLRPQVAVTVTTY